MTNDVHLLMLMISIFIAVVFPPILFLILPIWIAIAITEDRIKNETQQ